MLKNVADFLATGYDQKAAEYFAAGPKTLLDAFPLTDYRLLLTYEGGEKRIYNVKPLIQPGTVFLCLIKCILTLVQYLGMMVKLISALIICTTTALRLIP